MEEEGYPEDAYVHPLRWDVRVCVHPLRWDVRVCNRVIAYRHEAQTREGESMRVAVSLFRTTACLPLCPVLTPTNTPCTVSHTQHTHRVQGVLSSPEDPSRAEPWATEPSRADRARRERLPGGL